MRGVCGPALKRRRHWGSLAGESHGRQPDSGNLTVRDETGGLRKREPVVELGTRRTTDRVRSETLRLWAARAVDLSSLRGVPGNWHPYRDQTLRRVIKIIPPRSFY